MSTTPLVGVLGAVFALGGCSGDETGGAGADGGVDGATSDGPPGVTLARIQIEIFNPSCASSSCHGDKPRSQPLDLDTGKSHASLVNRPSFWRPESMRVVPGDPEASFLMEKISSPMPQPAGVYKDGYLNHRMPEECPEMRECLTQAQIELVRQWILAGAPNQ